MHHYNHLKRVGNDCSSPEETKRMRKSDDDEDENASHEVTPRLRQGRATAPRQMRNEDFTVGWICALPLEMAAAVAMLDDRYDPPQHIPRDINTYVCGRIGSHNTVIACLPLGSYGTNSAAVVASNMSRSFHNITARLMVGIGGGAPSPGFDIRLGDVVVGNQVIQYDLGKSTAGGQFDRTSEPVKPPPALMTAASILASTRSITSIRISALIQNLVRNHPTLSKFGRPNLQDMLFQHTYNHASLATTCNACKRDQLVHRLPRLSDDPLIHYGRIASGNRVIKDGTERQRLANDLQVLCFEMEAAGLDGHFPCLVIRGICDYADSHKNKEWQEYAAATAATYAKELLLTIAGEGVGRFDAGEKPPSCTEHAAPEMRENLLNSLGFDGIGSHQIGIKPALDKTCDWFLDDPAYRDWLRSSQLQKHRGFLQISGKPGAGKSTLMKFLYEKTRENARDSVQNVIVLSFFFNAKGVELEKSTEGMYRSLLYQFIQQASSVMQSLHELGYSNRFGFDNPKWNINQLQGILQQLVKSLGSRQLICFIDALDECDETQVREMVGFFESLCDNAYSNNSRVYVGFSSRHYPHIALRKGSLSVVLESKDGHKHGITEYVSTQLRVPISNESFKELAKTIREKASGIFTWVVLVVNILNKELQYGVGLAAAKRRLNELSSLSDLLKDIVLRDDTNRDGLLLTIGWILYASRPLKYTELYYALRVGLDTSNEEVLAKRNTSNDADQCMRLYVLQQSKGLATITADRFVEFIHESVRDFLLKDDGIRNLWPQGAKDFETLSHNRLKACCQSYMKVNFLTSSLDKETFSDEGIARKSEREKRTEAETNTIKARMLFPFLEYAVWFLFHHANAAAQTVPQTEFIQSLDFERWRRLINCFLIGHHDHISEKAHPISIFCEHGYRELIESYIDNIPHIASTWGQRCSLNVSTIIDGFMHDFELGKRLLATVDVELKDANGRTLLSVASEKGLKKLTLYLLETAHANVNTRDHRGYTPLFYASRRHPKIVRQIMATKDVDAQIISSPIKQPKFSQESSLAEVDELLVSTPVWQAVHWGQEATVKFLLDFQEKSAMYVDLAGALMLLALVTHQTSMFVLIFDALGSKTTDVMRRHGPAMMFHIIANKDTRSFLDNLKVGVFEIKLMDTTSNAPLIDTVRINTGSDLVEWLLSFEGINVNLRDWKGDTPLITAIAEKHWHHMVEMLLDVEGIDINLQNDQGMTALSKAVCKKHDLTVSRLLQFGEGTIQVNLADRSGFTPLIAAAKTGPHSILELLLSAEGIDVNRQDLEGRTALSWAAGSGRVRETELLLANEETDIEVKDASGRTALSRASKRHKTGVETILLNAIEERRLRRAAEHGQV